MVKKVGGLSMSFGAIGGLLVFSAIPGYFPLVIVSIFFFFVAYKSFTLTKCRYIFVIISFFNFIVGNGLYFAPHSDNDGLNGYGIIVAIVTTIVSMIFLLYITRLEEDSKEDYGSS